VSGDYLKQLQLAKQLEQKTKEAGRNRKEAEDLLTKAEKDVATTKGYEADAAEAERLLEEARYAHSQKDYKEALSLAAKSSEAASKARAMKVESIIASAEQLASLVQGEKLPPSIAAGAGKARSLLAEGSQNEAYERARGVWGESEKFVNKSIGDLFGTAQTLALVAERAGVNIEGQRHLMSEARASLEAGKYEESVKGLNDCVDLLTNALKGKFSSRAEAIRETVDQSKKLGGPVSKADELLKRAVVLLESRDVEGAFATLSMAETEAGSSLTRNLSLSFDALRTRAGALSAQGVDVGEASEEIARGKDLVRSGNSAEALESSRLAGERISSLERDQLVLTVSKLRSRLLLAQKVRADVSGVMAKLDAARQTMAKGDFAGASKSVTEAESLLEAQLEGYKQVETELEDVKSLLALAERVDAEVSMPKALAEQSRRLVMRRDFVGAVSKLNQAQKEAHGAIQGRLGGEIMKAEMKVTAALRMGADITKESSLLEDIVSKTREGRYDGLRREIDDCLARVEEKISAMSVARVDEARALVESEPELAVAASLGERIRQAEEALRTGQNEKAYELGSLTIGTIRREQTAALDQRIDEAKRLLSIATDLGGGSVTLNEKLRKAEDQRIEGRMGEALQSAEEVASYSRSILKDELSRRNVQLTRQIAVSRKNGVEVLQAERLSEESSRYLTKGELEKSYSLVREGEITLEKLARSHTEIYDRLSEIGLLIKESETQGLDVSKASELLASAKSLFEAGRYDEARPATAKAFVETEKLAAPFAAPRRIQAATDLIAVARRMMFDYGGAEMKLAQAQSMLEAHKYTEAMAAIREAERTVAASLRKGTEEEIQRMREELDKARGAGTDISVPEQIVAKAETLLREKRVYDSLGALELAKNELNQALTLSERAQDAVQKAQSEIADAKEFGVDVTSAGELLRQARSYLKMGRHGISLELSKKAGDQASHAASDLVRERVRKLELEFRHQNLEGPDLDATMRAKAELEGRLEQGKFKEATAVARSFEEELTKVRNQKEMARKSLEDLNRTIVDAKAGGLKTEAVEEMARQAQARFAKGSFYDAFALVVKAGDELRSKADLHGRRRAEIEDVGRLASDLSEQDAKVVEEFLKKASDALAVMDFESTNLNVRRARGAALEALATSRKRLQAEFDHCLAMCDEIKLERSARPTKVRTVADAKANNRPVSLKQLEEAKQELAVLLTNRVGAKIKETEAEIYKSASKGLDISASSDTISRAREELGSGQIDAAWESAAEAKRLIGVADKEKTDYVDLRSKVEAKIENARRNGLDLTESIALYRQAEEIKARDHKAATGKILAAVEAADRAAADFLPDILVDIEFLDEPVEGRKGKARLRFSNEGKAMAREVCVKVQGDLEVAGTVCLPKLRGGEKASVDVEILPKKKGSAKGILALECKPVLSNDVVGFDTEFEVRVE
jgi:hypothetical protein